MDQKTKKNRHGKAKFQVLYKVQKVIKVTNDEQAKDHGLDDSMELVEGRRFKSVNPRRRQKQMLPTMFVADEDIKHDRPRRVSPMKNKQNDEQQYFSKASPRIDNRIRMKRMSLQNRVEKLDNGRVSPFGGTLKLKTKFKPMQAASPKNPQQEAVVR